LAALHLLALPDGGISLYLGTTELKPFWGLNAQKYF
jgi:hypothetical protein